MGLGLAAAVLAAAVAAEAGFPLGKLPEYEVRFKLTPDSATNAPAAGYAVSLNGSKKSVAAPPGGWSECLRVTDADMDAQASQYPNATTRAWPARIMFSVTPAKGRIAVDVETRVEGRAQASSAELLGGGKLGLAVLRDGNGKGQVMTLGTFNDLYYWAAFQRAAEALPRELRDRIPRRLVVADEYRQGDNDIRAVRRALEGMRTLGVNAIYLIGAGRNGQLVEEAGFPYLAGAVYQPPGFIATETAAIRDAGLKTWAQNIVRQHADAGLDPGRMRLFIMSDEPAWYYPSMYDKVNGNTNLMERFRAYLREQGLKPADLGAGSWEDMRIGGRNDLKGLPERRLAYWSQRFFPHDSALFFARCTGALQSAFEQPGLPVAVNWNFFAGRCYFAGGFGHNPDAKHPDAAMASHDWFEFGRLRGASCLWTEDWFADEQSFQWSYYAEKLWSAAPDGAFGGYIVPRSAGSMPEGLVYKTLALIGHGAKHVKLFAFGPEYEFPENCWSQNSGVYAAMVKALRLAGAAEELLYPGKPVARQVGLLHHLSAQIWDPPGIVDATNTDMNRKCAAYTAEMFDLYLALMHAQVPVEFVSEEDVIAGNIGHLKVLYLTEPNVPEEAQQKLAEWVRQGGVLFTTSQAATLDRYDLPCAVLDPVRGVREEGGGGKVVFGNAWDAGLDERHTGALGAGPCVAARGKLMVKDAEVISAYKNGSPAATRKRHGQGVAIHAGFLPGISYLRTLVPKAGRFPEPGADSAAARAFILAPVEIAGVRRPVEVDRPMVEAPALVSDQGLAVTLLNWSNEAQKSVKLRIRTERPARSVSSALGSKVAHAVAGGCLEATLDVETVDVLLVNY